MRSARISIAAVVFTLVCLGMVMNYSASAIFAYKTFGQDVFFLRRHSFYVLISLSGCLAIMAADYRQIRRLAKPALAVAVFLLTFLLLPGMAPAIGGAKRWFRLGFFSFQPSELARFCFIIYLADFVARKRNRLNNFYSGFLPPILILTVISALIIAQPDFGNAVLLVTTAFIMLFVAGIHLGYLIAAALISLPSAVYLILSSPYRARRILAFFEPWEHLRGLSYQLIQSLIALSSGGFFGVGLGQSKQKLLFLPGAYNDFIFAVVSEELGMLAAGGILILFAFLLWLGRSIILDVKDLFAKLLGTGIITMIILQAVINVAVCVGMLPTKGLPLPFISYGGTNLLVNMLAVGLLLNISRTRYAEAVI